MKITPTMAETLSAEMLGYEIRMAEIAQMLDNNVEGLRGKIASAHYLGKAATLAEETEHMIFSTRNTLCVAFGIRLEHKYPKANEEEKDDEQES